MSIGVKWDKYFEPNKSSLIYNLFRIDQCLDSSHKPLVFESFKQWCSNIKFQANFLNAILDSPAEDFQPHQDGLMQHCACTQPAPGFTAPAASAGQPSAPRSKRARSHSTDTTDCLVCCAATCEVCFRYVATLLILHANAGAFRHNVMQTAVAEVRPAGEQHISKHVSNALTDGQ